MAAVCLTDTYTGSGIKNYPFSFCATSETTKKYKLEHTHKHTSFHMPVLFSCVHLHSTHTQSLNQKVKRAWRAQAVKLNGKFSWSSEAWSVPIPVPWPESQETHTGNGFTQQDHNASSKKTESNQISAACNTPPPLYPWKHPVYVYFPHPIAM